MRPTVTERYGYWWKDSQWQELTQIINTAKRQALDWGQPLSGTDSQIEARFANHYAGVWKLSKVNKPSINPGPDGGLSASDLIPLLPNDFDTADSKAYASAVKAVIKYKSSKNNQSDPSLSDFGYKWNLPPHRWSLPYSPNNAYPNFVNNSFYESGANGKAERRGRIRWRWASDLLTYADSNGKTIPADTSNDRKYGFQFMWNPEQFSMSTAINYSSTASPTDFAIKAPGWFPGAQNLDITIRLDRTNDFACFKTNNINDVNQITPEIMKKWYPERLPNEDTSIPYNYKVRDLLTMGTMADVDYLYRTINDPKVMQNNLGRLRTADAGYLSFTPVEFTLGPLGYVGFITGISVNHIGFTENYVPIRTDVTINARIMANSTSIAGSAERAAGTGDRPTRTTNAVGGIDLKAGGID